MMRNPNLNLYVYVLLNITLELNKDKHGLFIRHFSSVCLLSRMNINSYAKIRFNIQHTVNIKYIVFWRSLVSD